jgi:D-apionolactonase
MTSTSHDLRLLHGADVPLASMRAVRAGPVSLLLDGADLRYVRIGSTELLRRVYVAVRDADWRTVAGAVSRLQVDEGRDGFRVEFDCRNAGPTLDLSWHGTIVGDANGRLEYVFDARAERDCPYSRIGICVHHPWRETAGAAFSARTPDGEIRGCFPELIGAQLFEDGYFHALFAPFDRLEVELREGGGRLLLEFEGDLWETEDHRNWTDANFKTYSTPLGKGRPAPLRAGQRLKQRVVMTPPDVPVDRASAASVRLRLGAPTDATVPPIGLAADSDGHRPDEDEEALLTALAPRHLRVEVNLSRADWPGVLATGRETAARIGSQLELALLLREEQLAVVDQVATALATGAPVARVLVYAAGARPGGPGETTPSPLLEGVRELLSPVLPQAAFHGGTEMYFAELNRRPPAAGAWDGVCYSITPQVHALTDVDVVENLDAQGETIRSARALSGGKPVVISPITLAPRENFYAADRSAVSEVAPGRLPPSVDARQASLYGAAWTAASLKYVAEAAASSVTYFACTGWDGVVERSSGTPLPGLFPSRPGQAFPLYHPLADACEWEGARVIACTSTDALAGVGLAVRSNQGTLHLLVANLTPRRSEIVIEGIEGAFRLRRLDENAAVAAGSEAGAYRSRREPVDADGSLSLALAPYEVARLDGTAART